MGFRTTGLPETVGFELLDAPLAQDVEAALREALAEGAIFPRASDPLLIFRESLAQSIREIEGDKRGLLIQRFLRDGPYEGEDQIPAQMAHTRLSDDETAAAIAFIYSYMVNCFQGQLAELLATAPCVQLLNRLQREGRLPPDARLFVGDAVGVATAGQSQFAKGADLHMLVVERLARNTPLVAVAGVVEVKSYPLSQRRILKQIDGHLRRVKLGLRIGDEHYPPEHVRIGWQPGDSPVRIAVVPANWALPRTFRYKATKGGRLLLVDPGVPPAAEARVTSRHEHEWRITLRWSKEALASAAYAMTCWYMEKVGEVIYRSGVPNHWSAMTPAEAGRNAVKMMLYYAILRSRDKAENQRAVALYNTYGFGYALGMSFKNEQGARQMLWPEDLDEIAASGRTKHGCRIAH